MIKSYLCRLIGHKWKPVYMAGQFELHTEVRFIGTYCQRCYLGYQELIDLSAKMTDEKYKSFSESFFDNDNLLVMREFGRDDKNKIK